MAISQVFIEVIDVLTHLGRGKAISEAKIITRESSLPFPKQPGRSCCQFPRQNPTVAPSVLQVNPRMLQEGQPLLNLNILTFLTAYPKTQLPPGSFPWAPRAASLPQNTQTLSWALTHLGIPGCFPPAASRFFSVFPLLCKV